MPAAHQYRELHSFLHKLNINLAGDIESALFSFIDSILFWEKTHNIVSNKSTNSSLMESVFDSLVALNTIQKLSDNNREKINKIVDVGAGGGFPGIPLSIFFSEIQFSLVDSDRKKCSFLRFLKSKLCLKNIVIINKNIQNISPYPLVITRAAFPPERIYMLVNSITNNGFLIVWSTPKKSVDFIRYLLPLGVALERREDYQLGEDSKDRCLLSFRKCE